MVSLSQKSGKIAMYCSIPRQTTQKKPETRQAKNTTYKKEKKPYHDMW